MAMVALEAARMRCAAWGASRTVPASRPISSGRSQPWCTGAPRLQPKAVVRSSTTRVTDLGGAAAPSVSGTSGTKAAPAPANTRAVVTSNWPCKGGSLVRVLKQSNEQGYQLHIELTHGPGGSKISPGTTVELHWGVYRSSPHLWQHPAEVVPAGSKLDDRSGAMCSMMAAARDSSTHSIMLSVPASLAPLTLAFVVCVCPPPGKTDVSGRPARRRFITPLHGRNFSALIGTGSGSSERQGAILAATNPVGKPNGTAEAGSTLPWDGTMQQEQERHTVNFAMRCHGAERVCLVLVRPQPPGLEQEEWGMMELVLDPVLNRTGEMWHIAVEGLHSLEGLCYGWRLEGDVGWESGERVQPYQLLLDPYNPSLRYFPADAATEASPVPLPMVTLPDGSKRAVASSLEGLAAQLIVQRGRPAGLLAAAAGAREEDDDEFVVGPGHSLDELRLLELDVRTFAQGKGVQHPGSFLGVAERVAHIRAVGANAVVLTPSYATAKGIGLMARAAVHYMAADPLLASTAFASSAVAAVEFRSMLSALHAADTEVLLMLDLTFTAEGTDESPHTLSLRGLDHAAYYRSNGVLNCGDPCTRQYLLDMLHHWADEGVDGFCFINAENLVQDRNGTVLDAPPLADAICHDPRLCHLKLVALTSDDSLLPRQGVRGFPHWGLWQQRNTAFGTDLMAYLAEGTPGLLTAVAGRLTGSAAVFDANWDSGLPGNLAVGRRPAFGINSITVLGRQSLAELAAEAAEVAAAAGAAEAAQGFGASRPPAPSSATISKSLLALAILSSGVPIVPQDAVADLPDAHFVGVLMRLRRRLAPLLLPPLFNSPRDIRWHSTDAAVAPIWDADLAAEAVAAGQRTTNYLAFSVLGVDGQSVYVGINPHPHPVTAKLPARAPGRSWERIVDTSLAAPEDALLEGGVPVSGSTYQVASKAVVVLQSAVLEAPGFQAPQQLQQQQPTYQPSGYDPQPAQTQQLTPQQMQLRQLLLSQQQQQQGQP